MPHPLHRTSLCAVCLAAFFAGGCVTDPADNARKAWWVSRGNPDRNWLGMQRKAKPSPKLALSYAQYSADTGNLDDARQSFEMVLKEDPRSVDAIIGLARLDQLAGRSEHAEQGFQKALKLRPGDPAALDALGQFYAAQKRWPDAVQNLNAAVLGAPNEKTYRYHFAVALASSGDENRALQQFAMTVSEAEAHYNVGYILYGRGDVAGAERQFLAAVLKQPDLEVAQQMLDDIRSAQGQQQILPASAAAPQRERRVQLSGTKPVEPPVNTAFHELPHAPREVGPAQPPQMSPRPTQTSNTEIPFGEPSAVPNDAYDPFPQGEQNVETGIHEPPQWNAGGATPAQARPRSRGASEPPAWTGHTSASPRTVIPFGENLTAPSPRPNEPPAYQR